MLIARPQRHIQAAAVSFMASSHFLITTSCHAVAVRHRNTASAKLCISGDGPSGMLAAGTTSTRKAAVVCAATALLVAHWLCELVAAANHDVKLATSKGAQSAVANQKWLRETCLSRDGDGEPLLT